MGMNAFVHQGLFGGKVSLVGIFQGILWVSDVIGLGHRQVLVAFQRWYCYRFHGVN